MYDTGPNTSKGFRVIRREREGNGEHESHATAALGLLFADSGGDGYERERIPQRFTRSYRRNGVRDQVEGEGREKEAKGGIRPETRDLHVYLLVAH